MTQSTQQTRSTRSKLLDTKLALIRDIIAEAGSPLSAREISRRLLGKASQTYHMLPSEVSAIIRIHLRDEVKSHKGRCAGALALQFASKS